MEYWISVAHPLNLVDINKPALLERELRRQHMEDNIVVMKK
jgi:hypothetical protein